MSSTMASEEDMASRESLTEDLFFMRPSPRPSIHRKGFTATTYSSSMSTKSSFSSFSSSSSSSAGAKYQPSLVRTTSTSSSTYSSDDSPTSSPGPETGTAEFLSPRSWFQTSVKTSESGHQTAALAPRESSGSARQSSAMVTERSSSRRDFSPLRGWTEGWMKVVPAYGQDTASAGIGESYLWSGIGGGGLLSALGNWRVWGNKATDDEIPNGGRTTSTSICTASSKTSTTYRGSAQHGGTHSWSEGWMKRQHVENKHASASTEKQAHSETSSETVVTTEHVTVSQTSSSAVITSQTTDVEQEGWSADSATSGDQYGDLSLAKGFAESEDHLQEGEDEVKQMDLTVQTSWNQASSNQNIDTTEQEMSYGRDVHQSVTQHREVAEDAIPAASGKETTTTAAREETISVSVNITGEQGEEVEQGEQKDEGYKTEEELEETMVVTEDTVGVTDETGVTEESTTVTCVANSETTDVSVTIISESLEQDKQVEIMHLEEETGEKLEEDYEGGEMRQVTVTEIQEETVADALTDVSQTSVSERLDHDEQAKVMIVEEEKQKTEQETEEGHDEEEEEQEVEDGLTEGMVTVISTESTTTIITETGALQETKVSVISSVGGVSDEQEKEVRSTAEEQHREEITEEMYLEEGDTVQEVQVEETGEIITEAAGKRRRRTYSGGLMSYIVPDEEEEEEEMERETSSEEEPMEVSEESRMETSTGQTETIIAGVQEAASESMEVEISTQSDASSSQTVTSKMTVTTLTLQENGQVQQHVSATSTDVEMVGEASQVLTSATEEYEAPGASEATNEVTDITEAGETLDEAAVVGGLEASGSSTVETTGTSTKTKVEESTMTSEDVIVEPQEQASIKTTATKRGRPKKEDRRARATTRPESRSYFLRAKLGPREAKLRAGKALEPATTGQGHKKGEETKNRKRQRVQEDSNSTTAAQQKKQKTVNAAGASVVTDVSLVLSRVDEQKHSDEENTTVSETMEGTLTVSETDPREEQENDEEEKDESASASTEVQTDLEVASVTEKAKETGEGHKDETVTDKNITIVSARVIAETPSKGDYWFRSRRKRRLFDTDDGYKVIQTSTGRKHSLQEERYKKKFAEETGNLSLKKAEQVSSLADADDVDEDNKEDVLAHDKAVVTTTVTESKEQDEFQKDTPVNKSNQKKAARVKTTTKKTEGGNKDVGGQKRSYWLRGQKAAHGPSMTMAPPAAKTDSMETATETRQSNVGSPLKKRPYFILASTKSSTSRSVTTTATSTVKTVIANTSTGHNAEQEVTSGDIQKQVETSTVVIENQEEYATKGDDEPQLQTELSAEECDTDAGISVESQAVTIIEEAVIDETEDMQTKASVETTDEEVDVQVEVSTVTEENEEGKETEIHPKDEQTRVVEEVLQEEEEILEVEAKEGEKEIEEKEEQEEEEEKEKEAVGEEEEEEDQEPVVEGAVEEAEQDQIETQEETEVEERESEDDDEGIEEMEQTQVKTRRQGRRGNYNLRSRTVYYGSGPSARSGFLAAIATASLSLVHDSGEDTDKVDDGEEMEQEQDERQEEELEDKENEEEDEEETREQEQVEELEEEEKERDIVEMAEESGKSDEGDAMEQEQDERQEEELKDKENEKEDEEERREQAQVEELSGKEKETDMEERAKESGTPDEGDIMEQEQDEQQKEELEQEEKKAEEEEEIQFAKEQTQEVEEAEVDEQEQDQDVRQKKEESEGEEKEEQVPADDVAASVEQEQEETLNEADDGEKEGPLEELEVEQVPAEEGPVVEQDEREKEESDDEEAQAVEEKEEGDKEEAEAVEEEEEEEEEKYEGRKQVVKSGVGRRGNYSLRSRTVYYGSGPSARSGFLAAIATTAMSSGAKDSSKRTTMTSTEETTTTRIVEGDLDDESDKLDEDVMEQGREEHHEEKSEEEVIEAEEEDEEEKGEESINVDKGEEETEEDDAQNEEKEKEIQLEQVPSEEVAAVEQEEEEETQKEADGEKEGQLEVEQEQVASEEEEAVVEMEIAEQDERKEEESDEEEAQAVEEEEEEEDEEKNEEGKQVGRSGVGRRGNYSLRSRTVYYGSGPSARGGFLAAIATTAMSRTGKSQTKIYDANSEGKARGHSSLTSKKTTMTSSEEMATATLVDKGVLEEESGVEESRSVEDITVVSEPSEAELQTTTTYFITEITEDGTKGDEMSVDAGTETTSLTRTTVSTVTTTTETDNTMLQDVTSTAGGKTIIEEHADSIISSASAVVTHDKGDDSDGEEISDDAGEEQVSEGSFHESMVTDVTSTTETDVAASVETDTAVSHETVQETEQSPEQKETMETIEESLIAMAVEDDRMEREAAAKKRQTATAEVESDSEAEAETKVTESEEGTVTRRRKGGSRGNYSLRSRTAYYGSGPSARAGFRAAMAVTAIREAGADRTKTSKAKAVLLGKAKETDVSQASSTSTENSEDSHVVDQEAAVMETSSSQEESSEEIQESSVEDTATVESLVDQTVEQQADRTLEETTEHQDALNADSEDTLSEQQESDDKDANTSDTEVHTGLDVGQETDQTSEEDSNDQEIPQASKVADVAQIDAAEVPPVPTKASKKRKLEEYSVEERSTKTERSQKGSRGNYSLRSRTVYYGSGPSARSGFLAAIATATMSSKQGQSVSSRSTKTSSRVVKSGDDTGEIEQAEEDNAVTIQDAESDDSDIVHKAEVEIVSEDISTSTKLQEGEEESETVSTTIVEGITDEDIEGVLEELSESAASGQMSLEDAMAEAASPKDILSENQEESGNETEVEYSTNKDKEAASEPPEEETSTLETDDIAANENDEEKETDKEHTIETLDQVSVDDQSSTTVKSFQTSDKQQDELNIVSSSTSKRSRKKRKIDHAETVELSEADSTDVSIVEEQTASTTDEEESEEMMIKTSTRKESAVESRESGGRSYWLRKRTVTHGSPTEMSVTKSSTVYESDSKKPSKGKEANTKATKRAATASRVVASKKSRKEATTVQTEGEIDSPSIATMSEVQEGSSAYHIQSTTEDVAATTSTMVTSSENSLSQKTDTSVMEEGETSSSTTTLVYEPVTASTSTETTVMTNVEVHSEGTCSDDTAGTPEEVMTTTTKTATSKRGSRKSGPKTLTNDEKMREAISASETEEAMVSTASTSSEDQGTTSESLLSTEQSKRSASKSRTVKTTTVTTSGRTVSRSHTTIVTKSSSSTTDIVSRGSLGQVYSMSLRKLGDKQRRVYTWNT